MCWGWQRRQERASRARWIRFDRQRKGKSLSNEEWESPVDADARVAKMKDGTTHLAYKAEHAVDLESGALVGVTVQRADGGDTQMLPQTLAAVEEACGETPETVVLDKAYHSDETLERLEAAGADSYVAVPEGPKRNWKGKQEQRRRYPENEERAGSERGCSCRSCGRRRRSARWRTCTRRAGCGGYGCGVWTT